MKRYLFLTFLALVLLAGEAWGADRYVRRLSGGAMAYNAVSCLSTESWIPLDPDTIAEAISGLGIGDTCYLCGEEYTDSSGLYPFATTLTTSENGLKIVGDDGGGDKPKLLGVVTLGEWTAVGANNEYYIAVPEDIDGGNAITTLLRQGVPLGRDDNNSENGDGGDLAKGRWTLDTNNTRIYYRLLDSETSAIFTNNTWESCAGSVLTFDGADNITLDNLHFYGGSYHLRTTTTSDADSNIVKNCDFTGAGTASIMVDRGNSWVIGEDRGGTCSASNYSNKWQYNRAGVIFGESDGSPNATNDADSCTLQYGWFYQDRYHYNQAHVGDHEVDAVPYSTGNIITKNLFQLWGRHGTATQDAATKTGVVCSIDGAASSVVSKNMFLSNYVGCIEFGQDSAASQVGTGTLIANNIFAGNVTGTITAAAVSNVIKNMYANTDDAVDYSGTYIADNTIYGTAASSVGADAGGACIYIGGTVAGISGLLIENNIMSGNLNYCDLRLYTATDAAPRAISLTEDYNLYYRTSGDIAIVGGNTGQTNRTRYTTDATFAAFQAETGTGFTSVTDAGGANCVNADPLLNASTYAPQAGSPCIAAGLWIPTVPTDYNGAYRMRTADGGTTWGVTIGALNGEGTIVNSADNINHWDKDHPGCGHKVDNRKSVGLID